MGYIIWCVAIITGILGLIISLNMTLIIKWLKTIRLALRRKYGCSGIISARLNNKKNRYNY